MHLEMFVSKILIRASMVLQNYQKFIVQGSSLSSLFGIVKKSYYAKFVLVGTT